MNRYIYDGPVKEFGQIVCRRWKGTTMAVSEAKARCNLMHQYKKRTNRAANCKISLPGEVDMVID